MSVSFQLVIDCADAGRLACFWALYEEGLDHYAVAMTDPEANEFDIN